MLDVRSNLQSHLKWKQVYSSLTKRLCNNHWHNWACILIVCSFDINLSILSISVKYNVCTANPACIITGNTVNFYRGCQTLQLQIQDFLSMHQLLSCTRCCSPAHITAAGNASWESQVQSTDRRCVCSMSEHCMCEHQEQRAEGIHLEEDSRWLYLSSLMG